MKKTFLPVLMYILFFGVTLFALIGALLMYRGILSYSPEFQTQRNIIALLPGTLLQALPAAVAGSLVLVLLAGPRSVRRNIPGTLLVIVFATALYAGPAWILLKLQPVFPEIDRFPLHQGTITQLEDTLFYSNAVNRIQGDQQRSFSTENTLAVSLSGEGPRIHFYPRLTANPESETLYSADGQNSFDYGSRLTPAETLVQPSEAFGKFIAEINSISLSLQDYYKIGLLPLVFYAAAHVLFMVGAWSVIRSSRWPLWNGLLAFIFFRAFFRIDLFLRGDMVHEGLKVLSLEKYLYLAPPAGFFCIFCLFSLWGLFTMKSDTVRGAGI